MDYSKVLKVTAVIVSFTILFADLSLSQPREEKEKKRNAVPEELVGKAVVPGFENIRAFGDVVSPRVSAGPFTVDKRRAGGDVPPKRRW